MPLTVVVIGLGLVVGWLTGGKLRNLADSSLGRSWLLFLGLAMQVIVDLDAGRTDWLGADGGFALLAASHGVIAVWIVTNRRRPGMPLIGLGLLTNAAVIWSNGAMPVDPAAITALGGDGLVVPPGKHELLTPATLLPLLADRIPLRALRTIISVGDVILAAGILPFVSSLMRAPDGEDSRHSRHDIPEDLTDVSTIVS